MHLLPTLALASIHLIPLVSGAIDCKQVLVDGVTFDISALAGPYSVIDIDEDTTGQATNTTYTFDLCAPLKRSSSEERGGCIQGAWACAYKRPYEKDAEKPSETSDVWSIAGDFVHSHGGALDNKYERLKGSGSHEDSNVEGVRLYYYGGKHQHGTRTAMIAEIVCDRGEDKDKDEKRGDDKDEKDSKDGKESEKGLELVDYKPEPIPGNKQNEIQEVLRLKWSSVHACEDQAGKGGSTSSGGHWGFFTWFIIILFLLVASYLIFGSWLNYNRHGARGWDLLPHGDTIRDVPYLLKDFGRRIVDTVQGGQSSQGYNRI